MVRTMSVFVFFAIAVVSIPLASASGVHFRSESTIGADDGSALLAMPTSAVVTVDGSILVSDLRARAILRFDEKGQFVEQFGQSGDGPGDVMFGAHIAASPEGSITMAGMTGRVEFMDVRWNYVSSFQREHASDPCRGLVYLSDGSLVLSVADVADQTAFDVYSPQLEYVGSYGETFAKNTETDWRFESANAGGHVDASPDGKIYYPQLVPFKLSRYSQTGELERETTELGRDFVPAPPEPEIKNDRFRVRYPWQTTGLAVLRSGVVVASAYHKSEGGITTSKMFVYDRDLEPIGEMVHDGTLAIIGRDPEDRLFVWIDSEDKLELSRGRLVTASE